MVIPDAEYDGYGDFCSMKSSYTLIMSGLTIVLANCDIRSNYDKQLEETKTRSCHEILSSFDHDQKVAIEHPDFLKYQEYVNKFQFNKAFELTARYSTGSEMYHNMLIQDNPNMLAMYLVHKGFLIGNDSYNPRALENETLALICRCFESFAHSEEDHLQRMFPNVKLAGILLSDSTQRAEFIHSLNQQYDHGSLASLYHSQVEEIAQGRQIDQQILRNMLPHMLHKDLLVPFYDQGALVEYKETGHHLNIEHPALRKMESQTLQSLAHRLCQSDHLALQIGKRLRQDIAKLNNGTQ